MTIPTISFKRLYHIGRLDVQPPANSRRSLEGHCLSVSEVPYAWRHIAELGRDPLWELCKTDNQFLDVHQLSADLKSIINQWGVENSFIVYRKGWITEFDGEEEGNIAFAMSESRKKAEKNWGADGEVRSRRSELMPFATPKLVRHVRQKVELSLAWDMLLLVYAEVVLGLDGVFWNENLDVYALSAPRAGIFPSKLSSWTNTKLDEDDYLDEEEY